MQLLKQLWSRTKEDFPDVWKRFGFVLLLMLGASLLVAYTLGVPHAFAEGRWPDSAETQERFIEAWKSFYVALLAGGFFSAVLNSMQQMDVFRDQLLALITSEDVTQPLKTGITQCVCGEEMDQLIRRVVSGEELRKQHQEDFAEIVYGNEFLREWGGTRNAWNRVSTLLFEKLFPEIQQELSTSMFDVYVPDTDGEYYMEDYVLQIEIAEGPEPGLISFDERIRYKIRCRSASDRIPCKYSSDFDPQARVTLNSLLVDDANRKDEFGEMEVNGRPAVGYMFEVTGKEVYTLERHVSRVFPEIDTKDGPSRLFRFARFVKNLRVEVVAPPNFSVFLARSGTINDLEETPDSVPTRLVKRYNGVLFPNQGFRLLWARN